MEFTQSPHPVFHLQKKFYPLLSVFSQLNPSSHNIPNIETYVKSIASYLGYFPVDLPTIPNKWNEESAFMVFWIFIFIFIVDHKAFSLSELTQDDSCHSENFDK